MMLCSKCSTLVGAIVLVLVSASVGAAQMTAGPTDDVESIINGMAPGDELVLDDGMYVLSGRFGFTIAGTAAAPIVIRAAEGATPHFHRPDASQNIWDIGVEHVVIRGIELSGGSAGLRVESATSFTLEDCHIHDTGDVAVRMNDSDQTYSDVQILRNHIHHTNDTGEGMYLGCNMDGCRLANSLIANNYIHHTNQASVTQGDGIEIKEGSSGNVVRDNVIHDTNYPCILTYSTVGNGPPNVIERNVMWNCGDHAIQSAADATIRNNIILGSGSDGIAMQPHQSGDPSNLIVVHNTIIHPTNDAISLRDPVGSVVIANNAVFAQSGEAIFTRNPIAAVMIVGNAGQGGGTGVTPATLTDVVMGNYSGAPPMDLFPADDGALVGAGDAAHVVSDDFNGTDRMGAVDIGAYVWAPGGNPGWVIAEGFKDATPGGTPPPDGGMPDGGMTRPDAGGSDSGAVLSDGGGDASVGGDDGGCGCRTVAPVPPGDATGAAAVVLLLVFALRRRA
jgi:MYXO-CTERM domain-containing protein